MKKALLLVLAAAAAAGLWFLLSAPPAAVAAAATPAEAATDTPAAHLAKATFAGGCFWCMEPPFDRLDGVISTTSGYTGGHVVNPTYHQVSAGGTGHAEAVQIVYDSSRISYQELLDVFWVNIDPEAKDRQFCDRGTQYRSAIFYHDEAQHEAAEASKAAVAAGGKVERVETEIVPFEVFYPAEDYHQDYYLKNPLRYKYYRNGCGRDQRLREIWGS